MPKTCEELYVERIENAIRGLKLGTKTPEQIDVTSQFANLKKSNPMMYEDLKDRFDAQVINYNNKKKNNRR